MTDLVLVGGTHASGKSTLATAIGEAISAPVVSRDAIKGGIAWSHGAPDLPPAGELARQAVRAFYLVIRTMLEAGVSIVAEHPFRRGISESDVRPLLELADARLIHCVVPREVALHRWEERNADSQLAQMLRARNEERWRRVEEPMDLEIPVLCVETSDGYRPHLEQIIRFARTGTVPDTDQGM